MSTDVTRREDTMDIEQARAIAALPPDMALMRMENDHIMAVAQARPRDYAKIRADLFAMIDEFPDSADDAIYNKPVGTVFMVLCACGHRYESPSIDQKSRLDCPRCDRWSPKEQPKSVKKFARGLSIRSAENVRVAFGFNRVSTTITPLAHDQYKITGTFTDYTNGNVTIDEQIVAPFYTGRDGAKKRIADDRFFNVTLKAEKSKVIREVVLRSVPGTLKAAYEAHCEKAIDGLLDEGTMDKIVTQFGGIGVTQQMLESLLGRPRQMGWTKADRRQLVGIWTAIKDGETTVHEVFYERADANATSGPTVDDLIPPKKAKKPTQEPEQPPAAEQADALPVASDAEIACAEYEKRIDEAGAVNDVRKIVAEAQCDILLTPSIRESVVSYAAEAEAAIHRGRGTRSN